MNGFWLVSTLVLWGLLIVGGLVLLALAREVEALHARLDLLQKYVARADFGSDDSVQSRVTGEPKDQPEARSAEERVTNLG